MKVKKFVMSCADGSCKDSVIQDEEDCPKCGLPITVCREKAGSLKKGKAGEPGGSAVTGRFLGLLDSAEREIARLKWSIQDRRDYLKIAAGRTVRLPDLDQATAEFELFIEDAKRKARRMTSDEIAAKLKEFDSLSRPALGFLRKVHAPLAEMAGAVADTIPKAKAFQAGAPKIKTYPASPEEKGGQKKMSKTKVFHNGSWVYLDTQGEELAEKAKQV